MYPWHWFRNSFDIGPLRKREDFCFAYLVLEIGTIAIIVIPILILFPDFFEVMSDPTTYAIVYEMFKEDLLLLCKKLK